MSDIFNMADTWDNGATIFSAIKMNVTDTASNGSSLLMQLQRNSSDVLTLRKDGYLQLNGATACLAAASCGVAFQGPGIFSSALNTGSFQIGTSLDVQVYRDAADVWAQRRSTNPQSFRVYNTFTDASNYERGGITWLSNQMVVGAERAGTGTLRSLVLDSLQLQINISGSTRWLVQAGTAHILASADNTNDIGASGSNRPRNLYMASWIRMATTTVASLPAAATAAAGARMFVTDALNPVFGSAVTGGGAVTVPVYSTGSAWNVG